MTLETSLVNPTATFVPGGQFSIGFDGAGTISITPTPGLTIGSYTEYTLDFTSTDLGTRNLTFMWAAVGDAGNGHSKPYTTGGEGLLDDVTMTVVPEPTTWIAGALVAFPAGMSTLRLFRKRRTV